ncbi:MAG: hypothetical protein IVW51_17705 [Thermaceae bacterium]|nr:hypothetical protein [Thermaceae bacterium]
MAKAEPIPLVLAQSIGLMQYLQGNTALQTAEQSSIKTILVEDLEGNPFVYLNFVAPVAINDVWSFGASLRGDEWKNNPEQWQIIATGATTARAVLNYIEDGFGTLQNLAKTAQALGGSQRVKRVVP